MLLTNERFTSDADTTIGGMFVDYRFDCFSLEDEHRNVKIAGETRIPAGRYRLDLRTEGGLTQKYAKRFPDFHQGMIWLRDVPNFKWVYIHVGNDDDDTDGCIVVGQNAATHGMTIGRSVPAYEKLYRYIVPHIIAGHCEIEIIDRDIRDTMVVPRLPERMNP